MNDEFTQNKTRILAQMENDIPRFMQIVNEGWSVHVAEKKVGWKKHNRIVLEKIRKDLFEFVQEIYFERRRRGFY